jgi:flagellar assembly factor FliW
MDTAGGIPEIRFVRPVPGFGDLTRFVLVDLDGHEQSESSGPCASSQGPAEDDGTDEALSELPPVLFELRSLEQGEVRFLVAVPPAFFPDYEIDLDDDTCADLDLRDVSEALVLLVLTVGEDMSRTTANLMAPIVVNCRTRTAAQVILTGGSWPVRAAVA